MPAGAGCCDGKSLMVTLKENPTGLSEKIYPLMFFKPFYQAKCEKSLKTTTNVLSLVNN